MSDAAAQRETVITWSDADRGIATVWTNQRRMVTRLRKVRSAKRVEVHRTEQGVRTGETWQIPVACILLRNPVRRVLTDTQRDKMRVRMAAVRNLDSQSTFSTTERPIAKGMDATQTSLTPNRLRP